MLFLIVPFCSIFILVGGWMTYSSVKKIYLGIAAQKWPTVAGQLSEVVSKDTSDSESSSREIQVRYSYAVSGQAYEGKVIHPCYGGSSFEEAHRLLEAKLATGKSVEVFYDPANPSYATLSTGFYSCSLAVVFGGLIFFGAGIGFLGTFWFAIAGKTNFADGVNLLP